MQQMTLTVNKPAVLAEVAQTTAYIGAKKAGEESPFDRIATVDEDNSELERFWNEATSELAQSLMWCLVSERMDDGNYMVELTVPDEFNSAIIGSLNKSVFSYLVTFIVAKWNQYADKDNVQQYALENTALQQKIVSIIKCRKFTRTTRPF